MTTPVVSTDWYKIEDAADGPLVSSGCDKWVGVGRECRSAARRAANRARTAQHRIGGCGAGLELRHIGKCGGRRGC